MSVEPRPIPDFGRVGRKDTPVACLFYRDIFFVHDFRYPFWTGIIDLATGRFEGSYE